MGSYDIGSTPILPTYKMYNHSFVFFFYFLIILLITVILVILVYFLNKPISYYNKNYSYECGFAPFFKTVYQPFDIQFYRVGLLFLLFDLEVIILLPWAVNFFLITQAGHYAAISFLLILFIGFFYEFIEGLLNWYPLTKYTYKKNQSLFF